MRGPLEFSVKDFKLVTEATARKAISEAAEFLKKHAAFFTNRRYYDDSSVASSASQKSAPLEAVYENAQAHYCSLDKIAKALLKQGGKVPPVLNEMSTLFEKLDLILNRRGFAYHNSYTTIGSKILEQPWENNDQSLHLHGWIVMAASVVKRNFGPNPLVGQDDYQRQLGKPAPFIDSTPIARDIAIHATFSVDRSKFPILDLDLGWELPGMTLEFAKAQARKEQAETGDIKSMIGVVWNLKQLAEKIRIKARKLQHSPSAPGSLTLLAEERGQKKLQNKSTRPCFYTGQNGQIDFGTIDMNDGREQPAVAEIMARSQDWLIAQITTSLRRDIARCADHAPLAGGRTGLFPIGLL